METAAKTAGVHLYPMLSQMIGCLRSISSRDGFQIELIAITLLPPRIHHDRKKSVFHELGTRALVCTSCETWGVVVRASLVRGFGVLPGHLPQKERFEQSHYLSVFIPT